MKKPHNFVRKTKFNPKKAPSDLEKLHIDFFEGGIEERKLSIRVFSAKI